MANSVKVMVVDDEKLIRWSLRQALFGAGHRVVEAGDGLTALELAAVERPDVMLLDLRLPGLGGLEVLRRVHDQMPECLVVIISAYCTEEIRAEALGLGAIDCIDKPFLATDVQLLVDRLVAEKQ